MAKFLKDKPFWVHILLALALIFLILFLFVLSLNWITKHGESSTVPAVTGKNISEAKSILDNKGFEVVVQDSVYYDSIPAGMVLKQIPEADDVIKVNRTVYVTINRYIAPDVEMPNLNGFSYKNAEMVLQNLGLRIGDTTFKPDFAKNTVLEASFNGIPVTTAMKIKMGSKINLVLGSGIGTEFIAVPDLVGLTYSEARALLDAQGIILGSVVPKADVRDTGEAFVYQQRPAPRTEDGKRLSIRAGQMVDIFLQVDKPVKDSVLIKPPLPPVNNQEN
ncbi:MAG: PASTA domain-containing protein [Bacteroidota bacterium]|nr:PASTA domain-containing protein [Bacteroidota bacterium]